MISVRKPCFTGDRSYERYDCYRHLNIYVLIILGDAGINGYQSFAPREAIPEMAHEIGIKLANSYGATSI